MKKALSEEIESTEIAGGANEDNLVNLTKLIIERNRKLELVEQNRQSKLVEKVNKEIDEY